MSTIAEVKAAWKAFEHAVGDFRIGDMQMAALSFFRELRETIAALDGEPLRQADCGLDRSKLLHWLKVQHFAPDYQANNEFSNEQERHDFAVEAECFKRVMDAIDRSEFNADPARATDARRATRTILFADLQTLKDAICNALGSLDGDNDNDQELRNALDIINTSMAAPQLNQASDD